MPLWKRAHVGALADIRAIVAAHTGLSIAGFLVFGLGVATLWLSGNGSIAGDELLLKLALTVSVPLAALLLYPVRFVAAIVRLDREAAETIKKLSEKLARIGSREARSLQLTLRPEDHELFEYEFQQLGPGAAATSIVSLKAVVKNLSLTKSVDEVKVVVVKKTVLMDAPTKVLAVRPHRHLVLTGDPTTYQASVPPDGEVAFDLCQLRETCGLPSELEDRRTILAPGSRGAMIPLETGQHVVTVKAFGRDVPPCEKQYLVTVTPTSIGYGEYAGLAPEVFDAA